jgi:antitoxin MazE
MTHLVRIGNSLGVRIPQAIIQQIGFKKDMNLVFKVTKDGLLISPEKQVRDGWEQKFRAPEKGLKNSSLVGEFQNEFDKDDWEW